MATLIRLPEVMARTGLSRTMLYAKVKHGQFPEQIKIGTRAVAWPEHQVDDWINQRLKAAQGEKVAA